MLPRPMRALDAEEARWFIELDETQPTKEDIEAAMKSIEFFRKIKQKDESIEMRSKKKSILVSEEAYRRLVELKSPNESFSDVIISLTAKPSVLDLIGTLTDEEATYILEHIEKLRKEKSSLGSSFLS